MSTTTKTKMFKTRTAVIWAVLLLMLGVAFSQLNVNDTPVKAESADSLQAQISQLQQEITANQKVVEELEAQADTLRAKIAEFEGQIAQTQKQIDLTNLKIKKLNVEIAEAEAELERQKGILSDSLRELYKRGHVSIIELLASSDSYSDFINRQEYLSRIETAIAESAEKVEALKTQLEADRKNLEDLSEELKGQRRVLDNQRADQQRLLDKTEGREAAYQGILADLKEQQAEAERALQAYIVAGQWVNLGPIGKGQAIGTVGNTGFSTGPHLHFEVRNSSGAVTSPWPFINSGWSWPTLASSQQVWQDYGNPSSWYYSGYHPGIDTGYAGETVVAMANGTIIARGCSSDYLGTPAYGYMVVIDHGNGYKSLYAHMLPPSGGTYSHCGSPYGF